MILIDYLMLNIFSEKTLNASFASLMFLIFFTYFDTFKLKAKVLLYSAVIIVATISLFQMSIKLNSEDIQRLINSGYVNKDVFNKVTSIIEDEENFDYQSGLTYSVIKKAIDDDALERNKIKVAEKTIKDSLEFKNQFNLMRNEVVKNNKWGEEE